MSPRQSATLSLEHVLLAMIDQKPMHGYELYQELCEMKGISLIWNIKQGLLYAILEKLEGKGLLSSKLIQGEAYPPRKYFYLTEPGRQSLQAWLQTPVRRARDLRQEFLAKLIIAHRYGRDMVLGLIHAQQQACQAWSDELKTHFIAPQADQVDEWLVYSFRVSRVKAVLDWLNDLEAEMDGLLDRPSNATIN